MSDLVPLTPLPADLRPAPQTLTRVVRAEVARMLRQGGLVGALAISLGASLVVGLGSIPVAGRLGGGDPHASAATPLALASATAALVLVVGVALHVGGHGRHGSGPATMVLVPDRTRLITARALALAALTATHMGVVVALVALVTGVASGGITTSMLVLALLGAASGGTLATLLAAAVAVLLDHPVAAALTLGAWWVVLPITVAALSVLAPDPVATVGDTVVATTPSMLAIRATDPGGTPALVSVLQGIGGLGLWVAVLSAGAHALFGRRTISHRRGDVLSPDRREPGRR